MGGEDGRESEVEMGRFFVFLVGFYKRRFGIRYRFLKISDIGSAHVYPVNPAVINHICRPRHLVYLIYLIAYRSSMFLYDEYFELNTKRVCFD